VQDLADPGGDRFALLDRVADVFPGDFYAEGLEPLGHLDDLADGIGQRSGSGVYDVSAHRERPFLLCRSTRRPAEVGERLASGGVVYSLPLLSARKKAGVKSFFRRSAAGF